MLSFSLIPRLNFLAWEQDWLLLYSVHIQQLLGRRKWLGVSPYFHIVIVREWYSSNSVA